MAAITQTDYTGDLNGTLGHAVLADTGHVGDSTNFIPPVTLSVEEAQASKPLDMDSGTSSSIEPPRQPTPSQIAEGDTMNVDPTPGIREFFSLECCYIISCQKLIQ